MFEKEDVQKVKEKWAFSMPAKKITR